MDRKDFLKNCGMICLSGFAISALLESCAGGHYYASSVLEQSALKIKKTEFTTDKKGNPVTRKYVLLRPDNLNFPIYLYKLSETEYSALWMECTHQQAELSAHGDTLVCPSHGSEFDKLGQVTQGPANKNLRKFKTTTDTDHIFIHLS